MAVDALGNIFISAIIDIRRADALTGIITTVAGNDAAQPGFSGDGGPATSAGLRSYGLDVDTQGNLFIADPTDNRVRVVPLPPSVALAPASLSFSGQAGGTTSAAQTITLTNTGLAPLTISSIAIAGTNAGDYDETSTCGGSLGAGANCAVNVTFAPTGTGSRSATLTVTDNAPGSPQSVPLSGTVQAPDFSLAVSGTSNSAAVSAGQTATYNLNIAPLGGLSGAVSISCSGAPAEATCSVSPSSATLDGKDPATITVSVPTTAPSLAMRRPRNGPSNWGDGRNLPLAWPWVLALVAILLVSVLRRAQGRVPFLPRLAFGIVILLGLGSLAEAVQDLAEEAPAAATPAHHQGRTP